MLYFFPFLFDSFIIPISTPWHFPNNGISFSKLYPSSAVYIFDCKCMLFQDGSAQRGHLWGHAMVRGSADRKLSSFSICKISRKEGWSHGYYSSIIRDHLLWQVNWGEGGAGSKERALGCGKVPYGFQQRTVVSEGSHHANKRNGKDREAQEDENDGWSKEEPFQGPVLLPFHFGINAHTEDDKADHLQRNGRKINLDPPRQAPSPSQVRTLWAFRSAPIQPANPAGGKMARKGLRRSPVNISWRWKKNLPIWKQDRQ